MKDNGTNCQQNLHEEVNILKGTYISASTCTASVVKYYIAHFNVII